jgi:uncharacterized protein YjbI with pentapeptide repeats
MAGLRYATFSGADATAANFAGCDLRECVMVGLEAPGALLHGARLDYADLSHANLTGADLGSAALPHANLHNVRDDHVRWDGATLDGARRTNLELLEAEAWQPPPRPKP